MESLLCTTVVKDSVFSLGFLKYVIYLCEEWDGCCVFCLYCETWSCRLSCMGSVSFSSCNCMFVTCVHPVAVLNGLRAWESGVVLCMYVL